MSFAKRLRAGLCGLVTGAGFLLGSTTPAAAAPTASLDLHEITGYYYNHPGTHLFASYSCAKLVPFMDKYQVKRDLLTDRDSLAVEFRRSFDLLVASEPLAMQEVLPLNEARNLARQMSYEFADRAVTCGYFDSGELSSTGSFSGFSS